MEFENEKGTANTWWAGMVTQYNPTNDQYAAFFPSDHTSRQMIKTIALFPRTLMHYTTAATLNNGEFLPIDIQATYLFSVENSYCLFKADYHFTSHLM